MKTKLFGLALSFFSMSFAYAENCKVEIEGNDQMKFNKTEITVDATCKQIDVTLKHVGKLGKAIMGHNWVLVETKNKDAAVKSGEKAGAAKDYAPDAKLVIAATKVVGGGESTTTTFSMAGLKKGGDYTFVCTFPAHASMMKGKFIVK